MAFEDTPKEKEDDLIKKAYEIIAKYEMDIPAVLFLETIKPLVWVGGGMMRIALSPYMMFFWRDGHQYLDTFEKKRNIEKLIKMIEEKHKEKEEAKKRMKEMERKEDKKPKTGWRKYLRF